MEIIIKATPEEIAKLLQAIGSSKEQQKTEMSINGVDCSSISAENINTGMINSRISRRSIDQGC